MPFVSYNAGWYTPERALSRSATVAVFSAPLSDGALSSMPRSPSVLVRLILPAATCGPYNALRMLFRIEWHLNGRLVSPHSSTTLPPCTINTAAVSVVVVYMRAVFSLATDQPAAPGVGQRAHSLPGKTLAWARGNRPAACAWQRPSANSASRQSVAAWPWIMGLLGMRAMMVLLQHPVQASCRQLV